jgi:hypothetical protein
MPIQKITPFLWFDQQVVANCSDRVARIAEQSRSSKIATRLEGAADNEKARYPCTAAGFR